MNIRTKLAREREAAAKPMQLQRTAEMWRQLCLAALLRGAAKRKASLAAKAA
jgi:hypothetical protein